MEPDLGRKPGRKGLDLVALSGDRSGRRQSIGESPLIMELESLSIFQAR